MATSDRGFASMSDDQRHDIASKGGSASGGNFKNDKARASEAGRKGAAGNSVEGQGLERLGYSKGTVVNQ